MRLQRSLLASIAPPAVNEQVIEHVYADWSLHPGGPGWKRHPGRSRTLNHHQRGWRSLRKRKQTSLMLATAPIGTGPDAVRCYLALGAAPAGI